MLFPDRTAHLKVLLVPVPEPELYLVQQLVQVEQRQHLLVGRDEDQLELVVQPVPQRQRPALVQVGGALLAPSPGHLLEEDVVDEGVDPGAEGAQLVLQEAGALVAPQQDAALGEDAHKVQHLGGAGKERETP